MGRRTPIGGGGEPQRTPDWTLVLDQTGPTVSADNVTAAAAQAYLVSVAADEIRLVTVKLEPQGLPAAGTITALILADDGGEPGAILGTSAAKPILGLPIGTYTITTFAFNQVIPSATALWFAFAGSADLSVPVSVAELSGTTSWSPADPYPGPFDPASPNNPPWIQLRGVA